MFKYLPFVWAFIRTYNKPNKYNYLAEFPYYKDIKPGTVVKTVVGFEWPVTTKYVATSTGWLAFESNKDQIEKNPKYLDLQRKEAEKLKQELYSKDT